MSATGLGKAKELYQNRTRRAKELKGEGNRIIGYFCCYTPVEIITAAGLIPFRIMGDAKEPTTIADSYLDTNACPYVRSCFDIAMKGRYDFLDGFIWPTPCDNLMNLYEVWNYNMEPPFAHSMNIPRVADALALKFLKEEYVFLKKGLESLIGGQITDEKLADATSLHNENRALLRQLYELRKAEPPLLYGSEVTQILVGVMSLPVKEANDLLANIISEAKDRQDGPQPKGARLLMSGNELDDSSLIEMIEDCEANVVIDDLCIGTRFFWNDIERDSDPTEAIAKRYLGGIMCPSTFRGAVGITRNEEMEARFGQVKDFAAQFGANGAIIYVLRQCDSAEWDAPDLRAYLEGKGLPVLHIEHDYSTIALAPLRTRVQAFVEMVI